MKVKNIAFSGVMSAILISAGANAATTTKIASQKYVDDKATQTLGTVSATYATKDSVTSINNVLNDAENGLVGKVTAAQSAASAAQSTADSALSKANANETAIGGLNTKVGDENSGLTKAVADVKTTADAASAAATQNATDISGLDTRVTKNTTDIKALTEGIDKTVADSIAGALTGEGAIKDAIDSAIAGAVGDLPIGTLTTDVDNLKTTVGDENSGLVKKVNDNANSIGQNTTAIQANAGAITTLNGGADTAGSVANTVNRLAIPKPSDDCAAQSGRCVLSVDTSGGLMWLDVTAPAE